MYYCWILNILLCSFISTIVGLNDPYVILGVKRSDPLNVIRSSYRKLAKEWHPDKNSDDPRAETKMLEINEAYEILSDPKKKEQYDTFGTTGENNQRVDPHRHFFHEFRKGHSFIFDDFTFGSNYHSHAQNKVNMLTRYSWENVVLPDSHTKLFLIQIYGEICFECVRLQPMWEQLTENMNNIGIGVYELNYDRDPRLARDIGAQGYPQFIGVVAGRPVKYKSSEIHERGIREFLSALLPHDLIYRVTNNHKDYFEQSFKDNKPQCLLFSKHIFVPLLFEVVAYEYRSKMKFAYVDVRDLHTTRLREKYQINTHDPAVVVLKEEPSSPVAIARGSALKRGTLRELVSKNLYFFVPRLSSQQLFDDLCPKMAASRRWLCVVLVGKAKINFSTHVWKLRQMAKQEKYEKKRVRFFYIYEDIQEKFINSFERRSVSNVPCSDGSTPMEILLLWRQPNDKVLYDWFGNGWCGSDSSIKELDFYVTEHVNGEEELRFETDLSELKDEHWHGAIWEFVKKTYGVIQHVVDSLDSPSWYNISSIGFIVIVVLGMLISCIIPIASEFISDQPKKTDLPRHVPRQSSTTILGIEKLDKDSQKKFIHEAKSGTITVAVIVDSIDVDDVASSPIIQAFADAIYGYTGNPCYTFTWLSIAENLIWCTEITNINKFGEFLPGTVLAMNGYRKYVYIFKTSTEANTSNGSAHLSANFVGLESSDEESDTYQALEKQKIKKAATHLRRELPKWLERLFDGTLANKIKVETWPKMES